MMNLESKGYTAVDAEEYEALKARNERLEMIFSIFTEGDTPESLEEMLKDKERLDWLENSDYHWLINSRNHSIASCRQRMDEEMQHERRSDPKTL